MDKKLQCSFIIEGPDADSIDIYETLKSFDADIKISQITCGIYYTPTEATEEKKND